MILFTSGDLFEADAKILVNSVNCVGVMGAGIALAFKEKYPEMFREYKKACEEGKVKIGQLHVWKNLVGERIINLPTKRHWRQPSRYEDLDAGLLALRDYLASQGAVRVAMPAIGCGLGGLDWGRIKKMIQKHLEDLPAHILVFDPVSSREAGAQIKGQEDQAVLAEVRAAGISVVGPGEEYFPEALRGRSAATLYIKGDPQALNCPLLAVLPSWRPSERESRAAIACVDAVVRPGVSVLVGYGRGLEQQLLRNVLASGAHAVVCLAEGILRFEIDKALADVWDEDRVVVFSAAKPKQQWSRSAAARATDLELTLASAALITDPSPRWMAKSLRRREPQNVPALFYIAYGDDTEAKDICRRANATAIARDASSRIPKVEPIIQRLKASTPRHWLRDGRESASKEPDTQARAKPHERPR